MFTFELLLFDLSAQNIAWLLFCHTQLLTRLVNFPYIYIRMYVANVTQYLICVAGVCPSKTMYI